MARLTLADKPRRKKTCWPFNLFVNLWMGTVRMSLPQSLRSCICSMRIDVDSEVFDTMRHK